MSYEIIMASEKKHYKDLITVLESYSSDPMGLSGGLPEAIAKNILHDLPQMPQCLVFLGYDQKQIAGGAVCFEVYSTFLGKKALNIHDLAVLPAYRGQGLGRKLLKTIEAYSCQKKMGRLTLEVRHDNEIAKGLYSALGYSSGKAPMEFWVKKL